MVKGNHSIDNILDALLDVALVKRPSADELLEGAQNLEREKWDWALPSDLLKKAYASLNLDIEAAKNWVASNYG
ncbi:hypothetical protein D3C87_1883560 [compost metagenome]